MKSIWISKHTTVISQEEWCLKFVFEMFHWITLSWSKLVLFMWPIFTVFHQLTLQTENSMTFCLNTWKRTFNIYLQTIHNNQSGLSLKITLGQLTTQIKICNTVIQTSHKIVMVIKKTQMQHRYQHTICGLSLVLPNFVLRNTST